MITRQRRDEEPLVASRSVVAPGFRRLALSAIVR